MLLHSIYVLCLSFFFFNDTVTTEIYTLSLYDALPISPSTSRSTLPRPRSPITGSPTERDRKSTRLNSSHLVISYAVFRLKKKKKELASCDGVRHDCCCPSPGARSGHR